MENIFFKNGRFELPFKPQILADSTSYIGNRLTTFIVSFPTAKLAELRTHRILYQHNESVFESVGNEIDLSMNANSSRAIPLKKQVQDAQINTFIPIWTKEQKGMNGQVLGEENLLHTQKADSFWEQAFEINTKIAEHLQEWEIHKQDASLLLNPFSFTSVLLTGDAQGWESFFNLRCKEGVYPAVREIAEQMYFCYQMSKPIFLQVGEWHYPYKTEITESNYTTEKERLLICLSKCALISFDNHTQEQSKEQHIERAMKMIEAKHQVAEHCYQVPNGKDIENGYFNETLKLIKGKPFYKKGIYHSNVKGWTQLRKKIESGNITFLE